MLRGFNNPFDVFRYNQEQVLKFERANDNYYLRITDVSSLLKFSEDKLIPKRT